MSIEYVLWGKKADYDWQEDVITSAPPTTEGRAHMAKAKEWALKNGFVSFRVSRMDLSEAPDFTKTLNI